jgi:polyvinyl alcohol dehydrogenase (cytochrome)
VRNQAINKSIFVAILLSLAPASLSAEPCPSHSRMGDPAASPAWNGWGADASNTRFQPEKVAQLPADRVAGLKLKWAFGFPGVKSVLGQPAIASGRVFIGVDTGAVYSLDAATGCVYWTYQAEAGVRGAVSVTRDTAYFGDMKTNVYAVNASTGELLWKVKIEEHPLARITGAPRLHEGRLYVPVASGEEGAAMKPNYQCCTFRGSVVALNAGTGRQIWKTYTIAEAPQAAGKNTNGVQRWGPAGAGVWLSPTIDPKRHALYVGTGDAYTEPAAKTTDAILAMDLETGRILWAVQDTQNDAWLAGCASEKRPENCPKELGPDQDFASPPILKNLPDGRSILVAGQKSGNVWAHDPDKRGAVVWKTALTSNTTEFGSKITWGGAADERNAYFGLATGGVAGVQLRDGERQWFTPLQPAAGLEKHGGEDGPVTAIPGVIFSGGWDGVLRALGAADGKVVWEFNTLRDFTTVNGVAAKGGSMGASGPVVVGGVVYATSGYIGVRNGLPGNVLLAFDSEAK